MSDTSNEALNDELATLYSEWFAAIPGDNTSFFERTLAEDWYYVNVHGEVRGKREYIEYIAPIPHDAPPNRLVELIVRIYDPLIVVHGMYVIASASSDGSDTRFSAVWARRNEQLIALAHHATTVVGNS
jgi:hypothetical protein